MNSTYELIFVCYANQTISFRKLRPFESPVCIINCIADALFDFFHRIKLAFYHGAFPVRAFLRAPNSGSSLCYRFSSSSCSLTEICPKYNGIGCYSERNRFQRENFQLCLGKGISVYINYSLYLIWLFGQQFSWSFAHENCFHLRTDNVIEQLPVSVQIFSAYFGMFSFVFFWVSSGTT